MSCHMGYMHMTCEVHTHSPDASFHMDCIVHRQGAVHDAPARSTTMHSPLPQIHCPMLHFAVRLTAACIHLAPHKAPSKVKDTQTSASPHIHTLTMCLSALMTLRCTAASPPSEWNLMSTILHAKNVTAPSCSSTIHHHNTGVQGA